MRSHFFNYFNILLLALFASAIIAQPSEDVPITDIGTISNDGDIQPKVYEICLDENDQIVIKVNIILDNLQIMGGDEPYGVIPSTYDDMYVEFNVNGQTNTVPVGDFDLITLPNGSIAFSFIAESLPFDFSDDCQNNADGFVSVTVQYRLVKEDGSTYPACLYENTMFTCYAYPSAPWCDAVPSVGFAIPGTPNATCYDEWFSGGYAARLYCDCEDDTPEPPRDDDKVSDGGDSFTDEEDINNRFVLDNRINAYPNPMGQLLYIESNAKSIRQIQIYNSRGDLIISNVYKSDNTHSVSLNTSELPKGLYLARIATDVGIKVIKVLK